MLRRALVCLTVIPAFLAGTTGGVQAQSQPQSEEQIPALIVRPVGTTDGDPNGGQWFVTDLAPNESKDLAVQLTNPARVVQTVRLYLADIRFDRAGVPEVTNVPSDIGTWGRFANPTVTIAPGETIVQSFTLTAPERADPGDHIGAVVVEHEAQGSGNIRSIKRVAVRLYATLPGDARRDFVIDRVSTAKDSSFFARELTVTVALRNTGRVRLEPTVRVDGAAATGSELLMSQAVEQYIVTKPVAFWGGPVRLRIDAETRLLGQSGPVRQMRVTVWVVPWHLVALLVLLAALVILGRLFVRRRRSRFTALRDDLRRMERLLATSGRAPDAPPVRPGHSDPVAAVRAASKQARRAGDLPTAERLERSLDRQTLPG